MTNPGQTSIHPRSVRRAITAAGIGTALEGFDLIIFAYLALVISKSFFPESQANALLLVFATYGASFLTRPLGAIVLGLYGDTHGRKAALSMSLVLMGIGSLLIACMPTYATIGFLAPLGILCARLLQGFAAGAEQGSASVYAAEQDDRKRGEYVGWMVAFFGLTMVLAAGASTFLSWAFPPADLESWAWRLPFLFGALVCPIGWYIRRKTNETNAFLAIESRQTAREVAREIRRTCSWRMAVAVLLYAPGVAVTYLSIYMASYAIKDLHLPPTSSFAAGIFSGITLAVFAPLAGRISDRYTGRYPMFLGTTLAMGLSAWPLFYWLTSEPSWGRLLAVQFVLTAVSVGHAVVTSTIVVEIFPTRGRVTAASLTSALAFMLFGGFAPLIYGTLTATTGDLTSPSYYVIFAALVCLPAMFWIRSRAPLAPVPAT